MSHPDYVRVYNVSLLTYTPSLASSIKLEQVYTGSSTYVA